MVTETPDQPADTVPLILDVDGTLLRTDLIYESFWAAIGQDFPATLRAVSRHIGAPARLKHALIAIAAPAVEALPIRDPVLARARAALAAGRPVHLVSGSDQALIDALAARLGLAGPHFGSTPDLNLTDANKAAFLKERFGAGGFDYIGNARPDLKSWALARRVIAVAPPAALRRQLEALGQPVEIIEDRPRPGALLRELRPHQWVKNLLVFVPLLAAHHFAPLAIAQVGLAFAAFCLGASSIYILNDLLDLDGDRHHPEKRFRPLAAGELPIPGSMLASAALAGLALILGLAAGPPVAALTLLYMAGSLGYSLWLKKRRWLDVLALAALFLLRVVSGAVAAKVAIPPILLAFAFVVFFVLACVKRMTALSRLKLRGHLPRRGYVPADLLKLEWAAYVAIPLSAALFLLYVFGPEAAALYDRRVLLSLAVVPVIAWLYRVVRLSTNGQEDYDPVRFVLHDRIGMGIALAGLLLLILAAV
ncbi:UbiA family prenyltransferase [Pseudodonghicola flavimaris]|uniref:UbiA family prenyltransferase n=1 Tax=Pseudodonghicola flavimaris TaxID=3050036 RepID=A0ABT7F1X8_9RHOB|nr:UbiA family prenyltransferase [Pseudodonghicola flavimaris]MDK3018597.1 UbiA family prenyltransferase [Pseudodonghicola flavimaris]